MADPKFLEFLSTAAPETLHEMAVENRLGDLRDECHRFTLQPPAVERHATGEPVLPSWAAVCDCGQTLQPTETLLINREGWKFCDCCFERLHRPQVEEELANDTGGDY